MKVLKETLSSHIGGVPASKQQIKHPTLGFLKDGQTIAQLGITPGTTLELKLKQRGGRR